VIATSPRPRKYRLDLPNLKRRLTPEFLGPRSRPSGSSPRRDRFGGSPPLRFA